MQATRFFTHWFFFCLWPADVNRMAAAEYLGQRRQGRMDGFAGFVYLVRRLLAAVSERISIPGTGAGFRGYRHRRWDFRTKHYCPFERPDTARSGGISPFICVCKI